MEIQPLTDEQKILLKDFFSIHDICVLIEGHNLILYGLTNHFLSNPQMPTRIAKMILELLVENIKNISSVDINKAELLEKIELFNARLNEITYNEMLIFLTSIHASLYQRHQVLAKQFSIPKPK